MKTELNSRRMADADTYTLLVFCNCSSLEKTRATAAENLPFPALPKRGYEKIPL